VIGHAILGCALWLQGYPDQGRGSLRQALAYAQEIEQPSPRALTHVMAGVLYAVLGRDGAEALKQTQALRSLGEAGQVYGVWAELLKGQAGAAGPGSELEQRLAQAVEAGSALEALGSGVGRSLQLSFQAQIAVRAGRIKMGLEAMDRALAWIEHTGVSILEAEMWRMRGELVLTPDRSDRSGRPVRSGIGEAEACFQRALVVARAQQARWLELRAAVSLARLWQAQGRRDDARDLLASVYGWFTEGLDTVDLVEAKALLAELG
jgi:predicted ATPase